MASEKSAKKRIHDMNKRRKEALKEKAEIAGHARMVMMLFAQLLMAMTATAKDAVKQFGEGVGFFSTLVMNEESAMGADWTREAERTLTLAEFIQRRKNGRFMGWIARTFIKTDYRQQFRDKAKLTKQWVDFARSMHNSYQAGIVKISRSIMKQEIEYDIHNATATFKPKDLQDKYGLSEDELRAILDQISAERNPTPNEPAPPPEQPEEQEKVVGHINPAPDAECTTEPLAAAVAAQ